LADHLGCDHRRGELLSKLKEAPQAVIGKGHLLRLMVLFLKFGNPLFEHHILFLEMDQEKILLEGPLNGLDDEGGSS